MIKVIDYDGKIKLKERAKWFSFSLATFFGGAAFFSNYYLYTILFGFATLIFVLNGFQCDTDRMVWEIKKELGGQK